MQLPDLSAHAAGLEVSSGIPWIISSAYSPPADVVETSCAFNKKFVPLDGPTGLVIAKPEPYLSLLVLVPFIQLSLSSRVGLLHEYAFTKNSFPVVFIGLFSARRV